MKTLREWRAERLMTVRELAQLAGLSSHKSIVAYEHGRYAPQVRVMRMICRALNVRPDEVTEFAAAIQRRAR